MRSTSLPNVLKISVISRVHSTSEIAYISTHSMKYFWYSPKKVNFTYFYLFFYFFFHSHFP